MVKEFGVVLFTSVLLAAPFSASARTDKKTATIGVKCFLRGTTLFLGNSKERDVSHWCYGFLSAPRVTETVVVNRANLSTGIVEPVVFNKPYFKSIDQQYVMVQDFQNRTWVHGFDDRFSDSGRHKFSVSNRVNITYIRNLDWNKAGIKKMALTSSVDELKVAVLDGRRVIVGSYLIPGGIILTPQNGNNTLEFRVHILENMVYGWVDVRVEFSGRTASVGATSNQPQNLVCRLNPYYHVGVSSDTPEKLCELEDKPGHPRGAIDQSSFHDRYHHGHVETIYQNDDEEDSHYPGHRGQPLPSHHHNSDPHRSSGESSHSSDHDDKHWP